MQKDKDKQYGGQSRKSSLEEFGQRFKEIRHHLKLLQKDFAANLDVTGSFLSEVEKGKAKPGLDVLRRLYLSYNVNLNYLLDGFGEPFLNRSESASPISSATGLEKEKLQELLFYIENAPVVRYAVYEFFSNYLYKNKGMIEEDMEKIRKYLQKKKQDENPEI